MTEPAAPFSVNGFRVSALVFDGEDVALIRRNRPGGPHYTTVGGNLDPGEDFRTGLARELHEELGLRLDENTVRAGIEPELCWIQLQMVTRPGPTPPPRKLHLVYRVFLAPGTRDTLTTVEYDEKPDGTAEPGVIEWVSYRRLGGGFPLFPLIGGAVAALPSPNAPPGNPELPVITDQNYTWR